MHSRSNSQNHAHDYSTLRESPWEDWFLSRLFVDSNVALPERESYATETGYYQENDHLMSSIYISILPNNASTL